VEVFWDEERRPEAVEEVGLLLSMSCWKPTTCPHRLTILSLQQYERKMKNPCKGVRMENKTKKMIWSVGSSMNTIANPNNHDNPMDAKIEK